MDSLPYVRGLVETADVLNKVSAGASRPQGMKVPGRVHAQRVRCVAVERVTRATARRRCDRTRW
jgi:hypothetical protein